MPVVIRALRMPGAGLAWPDRALPAPDPDPDLPGSRPSALDSAASPASDDHASSGQESQALAPCESHALSRCGRAGMRSTLVSRSHGAGLRWPGRRLSRGGTGRSGLWSKDIARVQSLGGKTAWQAPYAV
jgi:hypothetical protein